MSTTIGKVFEKKFEEDWLKVENSIAIRLHDQVSGYKTVSQNPCDFICFSDGKLFLIECKEHKGKSFPFSKLRQYDKLLQYKGKSGVFPTVILWLSDLDVVVAIPIESIEKMISDGKKSVNMNDVEHYDLTIIPSIKKRVYMDSDYSDFIKNKK